MFRQVVSYGQCKIGSEKHSATGTNVVFGYDKHSEAFGRNVSPYVHSRRLPYNCTEPKKIVFLILFWVVTVLLFLIMRILQLNFMFSIHATNESIPDLNLSKYFSKLQKFFQTVLVKLVMLLFLQITSKN